MAEVKKMILKVWLTIKIQKANHSQGDSPILLGQNGDSPRTRDLALRRRRELHHRVDIATNRMAFHRAIMLLNLQPQRGRG